jgi:hypothetical protein
MIFGILLSLFTNGCSRNDKNENLTNPDSVFEQNQNEVANTNTESDFKKFVHLIGMKDDEVVEIMGEGSEPILEEWNSIIYREYEFNLQQNALTAIVSYNDNGIVQGIYSYLPDYDTQKWEDVMTSELGIPTRMEEPTLNKEDGNKTLSVIWMLEGKVVSLFGAYGSLSIQIE